MGNHNFSIVFVWIVWWALLMLIVVPFLGRGWCAICPIPMPGEWLQNGALLKPRGKGFGLNRKWPRRYRNIWLQNIAFTLLALFSAVVLTQPSVTGLVLLLFLIIALATSLIFERRAFCRYLCPVGGFIAIRFYVTLDRSSLAISLPCPPGLPAGRAGKLLVRRNL